MPRAAAEVLDFWFSDKLGPKGWFGGGTQLDDDIRARFGTHLRDAEAHKLEAWATTPRGVLALLIVCDQFSRNVYRKQARAFALDSMALDVAARALAQGFDQQVPLDWRGFFYLPFEHDETLMSQTASVALFEVLRRDAQGTSAQSWCEQQYSYAVRHRDAIVRFGRFPARNVALGRTSTPAEVAYLREHAEGF